MCRHNTDRRKPKGESADWLCPNPKVPESLWSSTPITRFNHPGKDFSWPLADIMCVCVCALSLILWFNDFCQEKNTPSNTNVHFGYRKWGIHSICCNVILVRRQEELKDAAHQAVFFYHQANDPLFSFASSWFSFPIDDNHTFAKHPL